MMFSFFFNLLSAILLLFDLLQVHLFDISIPGGITFRESDSLSSGDSLSIVDLGACKLGLGICYDLRFVEMASLYRDLGQFVSFMVDVSVPTASSTTSRYFSIYSCFMYSIK